MYDFTLKWTPGPSESTPLGPLPPEMRQRLESTSDPQGASIFTAVQEHLGLTLQPRKISTEMLVIDSVSRPAPN